MCLALLVSSIVPYSCMMFLNLIINTCVESRPNASPWVSASVPSAHNMRWGHACGYSVSPRARDSWW